LYNLTRTLDMFFDSSINYRWPNAPGSMWHVNGNIGKNRLGYLDTACNQGDIFLDGNKNIYFSAWIKSSCQKIMAILEIGEVEIGTVMLNILHIRPVVIPLDCSTNSARSLSICSGLYHFYGMCLFPFLNTIV
jgi:hypothetical protein